MAVSRVITSKLQSHFIPSFLEVINESYMHNVPKGSETHFKVLIVSEKFEGTPLIKRHREVNSLLAEELQGGVHALSIVAKTPTQWGSDPNVVKSPPCLGGSKL
ncbi:bolA-like protein 1 [Bolinopsis microptera]|uniref:bolA-like protein 1 n=1 Tax=Bolinopsis microptera TaxID=2820187 RepID=UPI003078B5DC